MREIIISRMKESIQVKKMLINDTVLMDTIEGAVNEIVRCICAGGKLVLCGNGGSASDALHFAGEIVGRFQKERDPWAAVVLNADVATLTAIGNDYGYNNVFARQAEGHLREGDVFVGISTSGNSENVVRAAKVASNKKCKSIILAGRDGGKLAKIADFPIVVPYSVTSRVQESHIMIIHIICELVEAMLL